MLFFVASALYLGFTGRVMSFLSPGEPRQGLSLWLLSYPAQTLDTSHSAFFNMLFFFLSASYLYTHTDRAPVPPLRLLLRGKQEAVMQEERGGRHMLVGVELWEQPASFGSLM